MSEPLEQDMDTANQASLRVECYAGHRAEASLAGS
jgi:hypothetical protein